MQDATAPSELHSLHTSGDFPSIISEPAQPLAGAPTEHEGPAGTLKSESPVVGTQPLVHRSIPRSRHDYLPERGVYYAMIAGVIAGVVSALLTIVVTLVFSGTFHAASQQIAVDRLTVKTALALAGLVSLNVIVSLLTGLLLGVIIGRIAVRRRLGFLAGVIAGAVFYLITFLVGLIASYPGNLALHATVQTTVSLVISGLLLCLWSIGGGLVSLSGAWVATVRHPHYLRLGG